MKRAVLLISSIRHLVVVFTIVLFFCFLSKTSVYAVTFTFDGAPSGINSNESFSVTTALSISNSSGKKYYIRAVFSHPDSPSNYFGYTKNNSGSWYNGMPSIDYTQYYQITLDESSQWSGTIEVKPDLEDTDYKGPGTYSFKLGRYTEAGSGPTWCTSSGCSIASISISSASTPTSTPFPTQGPTNTPIPTPTPTKTPTPTSTPKPTPTTRPPSGATSTLTPPPAGGPTTKPSPTILVSSNKTTQNSNNAINKELLPTSILGETTKSASLTQKPTPTVVVKTLGSSGNNFSKILIGIGVIFLFSCGILVFRPPEQLKEIWKRFL